MFDGVIFHDLVWKLLKGVQKKQMFLCPSEEPQCVWPPARWWPCWPGLSSTHTSSGTLSTEALVSLDTAPLAGSWCSYCEWWWWGGFPSDFTGRGQIRWGYKARGKSGGVQSGPLLSTCVSMQRKPLGITRDTSKWLEGHSSAIKQMGSLSQREYRGQCDLICGWWLLMHTHTYINHNQHFLTISQGEYHVSCSATASIPTNCGWTKWC